jgi:hypothetical protein
MTAELDLFETHIRTDILAFPDPGTGISVNRTREWLQASWEQRGRLMTANFKQVDADSGIRVRTDAGIELSYPAFLASDRMADLRAIARTTIRAIPPVQAFVPPRAVLDGSASGRDAPELLQALVERSDERTKVIFVTADAGVGKTSLLTEAVRRKASEYALGRTNDLWLYVNAQGSRLARLDQALAASLDDVRAPFTYHAAASLVRCQALVLVIDGFDELVSAPGTYDDAYSSLATFLAALQGNGTIVATARSAYYEQEFLSRVGQVPGLSDDAWSLHRVELEDWNSEEQRRFLDSFARAQEPAVTDNDFAATVHHVFSDANAEPLAAKPFFLSRVAQFSVQRRGLEDGHTLLDRLVNTYLVRESEEKLIGQSGPILTRDQLAGFYEEIANEMWRQETRELSGASFKELVDLVAQLQDLPDDFRRIVVDRLPSSALVHIDNVSGGIAFQHELFFSYFIARPIIAAIRTADPFAIATALRRGRLPLAAGEIVGSAAANRAREVLDAIGRASRAISLGRAQIRQNGGTVVAGMLQAGVPRSATIRSVDFVDADLAHIVGEGLAIEDSTFRGADLRGARLTHSSATKVSFESALVNDMTVLDISGPVVSDFQSLVVYTGEARPVTLYSPDEIEAELKRRRLPSTATKIRVRNIDPATVDLVQTFARIFEHTNIASLDDEFVMQRVTRNPRWPPVFEALLNSKVCQEEFRQAGGNRSFVRMNVRPADLMAGLEVDSKTDVRVEAFWNALSAHR